MGVVISTVHVEAGVTAEVTQLTAGRTIGLASAANADAASSASGAATDGGSAAIGAAVALTLGLITVPYGPAFIERIKGQIDKRLGGREQ